MGTRRACNPIAGSWRLAGVGGCLAEVRSPNAQAAGGKALPVT